MITKVFKKDYGTNLSIKFWNHKDNKILPIDLGLFNLIYFFLCD